MGIFRSRILYSSIFRIARYSNALSSNLVPWCPPENLLQRNDDAIAIISGGELGTIKYTTFRELRVLVGEMASALRETGVGVED